MRTIRTKVYQFNELNESAQQKAIQSLSDINVDFEWWEFTYSDAKSIGLQITSFDLDRNKNCKGDLIWNASEVCANILIEHGESCDTYLTAQEFLKEFNPIFSDYMNENSYLYESRELENIMQDLENGFLNNLLEDYATILQKECEYLQSKDSIIKTIEANNYEFTKEGNRF